MAAFSFDLHGLPRLPGIALVSIHRQSRGPPVELKMA